VRAKFYKEALMAEMGKSYNKTKRTKRRKVYIKKNCKFCEGKMPFIDYKDTDCLRQFITERGKMLSRRLTGNCAKHQRKVSQAIKKARYIALLPFVSD
jgi:small subunit ribosomal protein S18